MRSVLPQVASRDGGEQGVEPLGHRRVGQDGVPQRRGRQAGEHREAGEVGGTAPCVLNASDEVAVEAFLEGRIPFTGIAEVIDRALEAIPGGPVRHFEELFEIDEAARVHARGVIESLAVA